MKSKLIFVTAVVTITVGLAVKAEDTVIDNRAELVGFLAAAQCYINNGLMTQEKSDALTRDYLNAKPALKSEFAWVQSSPDAKAAIQAILPYFTSDCKELKTTEEFDEKLPSYFQ